jgi:hypothetical protein
LFGRDCDTDRERCPHLFQLIQNAIVHAVLLEIDAHGVDDLLDDVVVDRADVSVRHSHGRLRWRIDSRSGGLGDRIPSLQSRDAAVVLGQPLATCPYPTLRWHRTIGVWDAMPRRARDSGVKVDDRRSLRDRGGLNSPEDATFCRSNCALSPCLAVFSEHASLRGFVFLRWQM